MSPVIQNVATAAGRLAFQRTRAFAWSIVFALALVDAIGCSLAHLRFSELGLPVTATAFMLIIALVYGVSKRSPSIADMAHCAALWIAFSLTGAVLTYIAASASMPLRDAELAAIDQALGFHWDSWYGFVQARPALYTVLAIVYSSLMVQILGSIGYFAHCGDRTRNDELWQSAVLALVLTTALSMFMPALGAGVQFGAPEIPLATYLPHLQAVRAGADAQFAVSQIQGIVTFPSYHTVLAVLITYAYRDRKRMFWGAMAVNGTMLLSIPPFGSHYLADMLVGGCVAALSILAVRLSPVAA